MEGFNNFCTYVFKTSVADLGPAHPAEGRNADRASKTKPGSTLTQGLEPPLDGTSGVGRMMENAKYFLALIYLVFHCYHFRQLH